MNLFGHSNLSMQRMRRASSYPVKSAKERRGEEAAFPLKVSSSSTTAASSRFHRRNMFPLRRTKGWWSKASSTSESSSKSSTSSSSHCHEPAGDHHHHPVTSSSSASSGVDEYSYHEPCIIIRNASSCASSASSSTGPEGLTPSIHELRSLPSMGESVLGVYLETSASEDSAYYGGSGRVVTTCNNGSSAPPPRNTMALNRDDGGSSSSSCVRVPSWMRQWKQSIRSLGKGKPQDVGTTEQRRRHRASARPRRRTTTPSLPWRSYYSRACRKPLADAVHSHEDDDGNDDNGDDDDDVDSLQASAHLSISCLSNHGNRSNMYAMDRLPWESHDDDEDAFDDDDDFGTLRARGPTITTSTDPMRSSASTSSSSMSDGAAMTLDSYLSRHNPQVPPSKASKGTKATKTTAASTTLASGTAPVATTATSNTVVDIAHVDTSDNQSVHSEMVMAVSFDHDYAQLVLTATAQEPDDDDDDESYYDDDELASVNDELLGIAHSHPAAADILDGHRCPSPPPSFVRGENKAPRYAMRHTNSVSKGVKPTTTSHRPRNPWRDMVVAEHDDDDDQDAGSFRGVEEWSVAAASVLIETTFTDWGESHDEDDDDESVVKKPTYTQEGTAKARMASSHAVLAVPKGSTQWPPRPSPSPLQREESAGRKSERDADEDSFQSSDSDCPFDERAWKAPHLRSAQPSGRPSTNPKLPRSGSKRGVQLVGV